MARRLRTQYPEAIYPVMNQVDRREAIFERDKDRERFNREDFGIPAKLSEGKLRFTYLGNGKWRAKLLK